MKLPVRHGHRPRCDECSVSREEARGDRDAARELDDAADEELRMFAECKCLRREHAEQLLCAVPGEHETRHDAKRRVRDVVVFLQRFPHAL
jgi:hypothetical protein